MIPSPFQISWPDKYVIALGVAFAYDPLVSNKINFVEKLKKESPKPVVDKKFNSDR